MVALRGFAEGLAFVMVTGRGTRAKAPSVGVEIEGDQKLTRLGLFSEQQDTARFDSACCFFGKEKCPVTNAALAKQVQQASHNTAALSRCWRLT